MKLSQVHSLIPLLQRRFGLGGELNITCKHDLTSNDSFLCMESWNSPSYLDRWLELMLQLIARLSIVSDSAFQNWTTIFLVQFASYSNLQERRLGVDRIE
jgi:hypothetical protein